MQVGPFVKILKNKGAKFSGSFFLKTNLLAKTPLPILFWTFS